MSISGKQATTKLDTGVPHSARLWNYWLGGKDNFAVDRQIADEGPSAKMVLRSADQLKRLFGDLEMVEPGVVTCSQWHPDEGDESAAAVPHYGGVGRKP